MYPSLYAGTGVMFSTTYVTTGINADLGIMVSNENTDNVYVAKSTSCILLKSNNRPIWGVMVWNNRFLEYDQVGFQKIVYIAVHYHGHIDS
jgi:hypothetical protein